jgi:hypothetical protein
VSSARTEASVAGEQLTAALRVDGNVVYELGGDRSSFEAIYQQYLDARSDAERLRAALAFTDALDVDAGAAGHRKLDRLRAARQRYVDARARWEQVASGFPGNLAVGLGLAAGP